MCGSEVFNLPEGVKRVSAALESAGHPHMPVMLDNAARTAQEAADLLGIQVGQVAKSIIFKRKSDDVAVLVVTSGDRRVDERKVDAIVGTTGRANAEFVKTKTGFSIGGVSPLAHATPSVTLIDRELFRFDEIWAAAGHPNAVFKLTPEDLKRITQAPVHDVVQLVQDPVVASPCVSVCKLDESGVVCTGCFRTRDDIAAWSRADDPARQEILRRAALRKSESPDAEIARSA